MILKVAVKQPNYNMLVMLLMNYTVMDPGQIISTSQTAFSFLSVLCLVFHGIVRI